MPHSNSANIYIHRIVILVRKNERYRELEYGMCQQGHRVREAIKIGDLLKSVSGPEGTGST